MYMLPEMIELGLLEGEKFSSVAHRKVAETVCICNSRVRDRTTLQVMVGLINKIPKSKIKEVTLLDLEVSYGIPCLPLA